MKKITIFLVMSVCLALFYFLWPDNEALPELKRIENIELNSIDEERYSWDNSKVKIVSFFYTSCPDICPLTLADMSKLQSTLKEKGIFSEEVELISITLDPEEDTIDDIKAYSRLFHADGFGWKWLTGSSNEITRIASEFQMTFQKEEEGFVTHSTKIYLVDQNQQIRSTYDMATRNQQVDNSKIISDINSLLERK